MLLEMCEPGKENHREPSTHLNHADNDGSTPADCLQDQTGRWRSNLSNRGDGLRSTSKVPDNISMRRVDKGPRFEGDKLVGFCGIVGIAMFRRSIAIVSIRFLAPPTHVSSTFDLLGIESHGRDLPGSINTELSEERNCFVGSNLDQGLKSARNQVRYRGLAAGHDRMDVHPIHLRRNYPQVQVVAARGQITSIGMCDDYCDVSRMEVTGMNEDVGFDCKVSEGMCLDKVNKSAWGWPRDDAACNLGDWEGHQRFDVQPGAPDSHLSLPSSMTIYRKTARTHDSPTASASYISPVNPVHRSGRAQYLPQSASTERKQSQIGECEPGCGRCGRGYGFDKVEEGKAEYWWLMISTTGGDMRVRTDQQKDNYLGD
ncbi:hypothetical protein BD779DRAFT_1741117 [Infundibulicybe gibba]|nr:hypothetical protein BD779DRAFT_1741117 [Infundibulicybe gibba]